MNLDALAYFADAETGTTSAAATSVIDTVAAGDSYEGCWVFLRVDTAFTAAVGTPTATFQLQTSESESFGGVAVTMIATSALGTGVTQLGKIGNQLAFRIPQGAKRYLRLYKVVTAPNNNFSLGAYDAYIVRDYPTNQTKQRYQMT